MELGYPHHKLIDQLFAENKFPMLKTFKKALKYFFSPQREEESQEYKHSDHLRESIEYADIGESGPLIEGVFDQLRNIPGWFNVDDCGHFYLILSYQSVMKIKGDLLEIGSYHGRSTALMAKCLKSEERIVICDAFESETNDEYVNKPSPQKLVANIQRVAKDIDSNRIIIHKCLSSSLHLKSSEKFRFIHIDGGHSAEQTYSDLELCSKHLLPNGIISMDDYHHKNWPGVTHGTDKFLNENPSFCTLADLNRHGAHGRKIYLIKSDC